MEKLKTCGYNGVKRWYKKVSIQESNKFTLKGYTSSNKVKITEQDMLLAFVNHGRFHWTLIVSVLIM